jgi:hypothetical protein
MSFMVMKLLSHLIKLLHLMTLSSQQFCLCGTLFNVHDTFMKHALLQRSWNDPLFSNEVYIIHT